MRRLALCLTTSLLLAAGTACGKAKVKHQEPPPAQQSFTRQVIGSVTYTVVHKTFKMFEFNTSTDSPDYIIDHPRHIAGDLRTRLMTIANRNGRARIKIEEGSSGQRVVIEVEALD